MKTYMVPQFSPTLSLMPLLYSLNSHLKIIFYISLILYCI